MYIYLNGQFVKEQDASISPFDYGYLYGIGFFETLRIYEGHPFLIDDHLERMNNALSDLQIRLTIMKDEVVDILHRLLELNGWKNASIRMNVSAGKGAPGLRTTEFNEPTVMIYGGELPEAPNALQDTEAKILEVRRNTPEGHTRWKSHHFLNNLLAKQEMDDPSMEGIFLTREGFVAEGVTSNVFWIKEGKVYTPSLETGILNGITRQYVLKLCEKLALPVQTGKFTVRDLLDADEAFMTNSVKEIFAINSLKGKAFQDKNRELTNILFNCYVKDRQALRTRNQ